MKTIVEYANKCLHEMNFGTLTTTECIVKYLDLWHKKQVGELMNGEHEHELYPRAETWIAERRNWIKEVEMLRKYIARLENKTQEEIDLINL